MSSSSFIRIVLSKRPEADILPDSFEAQSVSKDVLKAGTGEVVVQIGEVMRGLGLGVVVEAGQGSAFAKGDLVSGPLGWTEFAVLRDAELQKITPLPGTTPLDFLNTLGIPGLTAYFGLHYVGELKAGETLLVSAAAGSVGSHVCQFGKRAGARVVALAGSDEKCAWLEKELGVDAALNYKRSTFQEDFDKTVGYLDVFFDNVGGEILDTALKRLNKDARIVFCGSVSSYNAHAARPLENYVTLISMRAKIQGFIVFDYVSQFHGAIAELAVGLVDGTIKRKFHVVEGLENAPSALPLLFSGGNTGKLLVRVSDERTR